VVSYEIDRDAGIVTVLGDEVSSAQDTERAFRQILSDPNFRPGDGFLRDRRHLALPSGDVVRRVADLLARLPGFPSSRCAIVLPECDPSRYGMSRMIAILATGASVEIAIFFEMETARAWLVDGMAAESRE
jgi:hypothetical protein